jgi:hypothetical protein
MSTLSWSRQQVGLVANVIKMRKGIEHHAVNLQLRRRHPSCWHGTNGNYTQLSRFKKTVFNKKLRSCSESAVSGFGRGVNQSPSATIIVYQISRLFQLSRSLEGIS